MPTKTQPNVVAINKITGEKFYGADPYELMEELAEKFKDQGTGFELKILNLKYRFKI